jgi:DNA invertase Pin-like site-specific DNA recombinase
MRHYGIGVYFVSQQLDSASENFEILFNTFSMVDSMYNKRLRAKVFSGQKGRVLAGYHVGSIPYGYESETVENDDDPSAIGRAATLGSRLKIVENQAEVVRRIFKLFVDGHAMWAIARRLNREKVPSPQNVRAGKPHSEWSRDAIRHILRNEKYRGQNVWNVSSQSEHPRTGRLTKKFKPAHDHIRIPLEHLRIVDEELWCKAAERIKEFGDKQKARVLGGYSRAKTSHTYSVDSCTVGPAVRG